MDEKGGQVLRDSRFPPQVSQLSIVDLAGSERTGTKFPFHLPCFQLLRFPPISILFFYINLSNCRATGRTNNSGERLRETGSINRSISILGQCIHTLRNNQLNGRSDVVPFRDSQLTKMFKQYFEENGKVLMIVCVSPSQINYDETAHVLKFSAITQQVTTVQTPSVSTPTGLTPGRGLAHKLLKEARKKLEQHHRGSASPMAVAALATLPAAAAVLPAISIDESASSTGLEAGADVFASAVTKSREWLSFEAAQQRALSEQQHVYQDQEAAFIQMLEQHDDALTSATIRMEQLAAELAASQQRNAELELELQRQQVHQRGLEDTRRSLDAKKQEIAVLQQQIQAFSPERRQLQSQATSCEARLRAKEQEAECLQQDLHAHRELVAEFRQRLEQEQQQRQQLQTVVTTLQAEKHAAVAETEEQWRARVQEVEGSIGALEHQAQSAAARKKTLEKKFQKLRKFLQDPMSALSPTAQSPPVGRRTRSKRSIDTVYDHASPGPAQSPKRRKSSPKATPAAAATPESAGDAALPAPSTATSSTTMPMDAAAEDEGEFLPSTPTGTRFDNLKAAGKSPIVNHMPPDMVSPNTLMSPKIKNKKTVAHAKVLQEEKNK